MDNRIKYLPYIAQVRYIANAYKEEVGVEIDKRLSRTDVLSIAMDVMNKLYLLEGYLNYDAFIELNNIREKGLQPGGEYSDNDRTGT